MRVKKSIIPYENSLGKRISDARTSKHMSQGELEKQSGINKSVISMYENNNRKPEIEALAKIANALEISIDELYYGDASKYPITSASNEGRKIVNCIYELWNAGILKYVMISPTNQYDREQLIPRGIFFFGNYINEIERLLASLDDYKAKKDTFSNPKVYLEQLLVSAATSIELKMK